MVVEIMLSKLQDEVLLAKTKGCEIPGIETLLPLVTKLKKSFSHHDGVHETLATYEGQQGEWFIAIPSEPCM